MADKKLRALLEFAVQGDKRAQRALLDLAESGEKVEGGMKKAGKGTGLLDVALGNFVAGNLLKAQTAIVDFGLASIQAASDVEQMQGKFDVVFGEQSAKVEQQIEQMTDAVKRSKYEWMGYAATLQDTFVPLGFARDKAAEMSVQLVALAEDLASFNNLRTEDVVRDLQSALVGNTETLRKYGVVAQETQIKAKALELGLWDGKGAIDAQAKAATILQITLDGTVDAQGAAARESDSFESKMRELEAAVLDLQVAIGDKLLPVATDLINLLTFSTDEFNNYIILYSFLSDLIKGESTITWPQFTKALREAELAGKDNSEQLAIMADIIKNLNRPLKEQVRIASQADVALRRYGREVEEVADIVDIAATRGDKWEKNLEKGKNAVREFRTQLRLTADGWVRMSDVAWESSLEAQEAADAMAAEAAEAAADAARAWKEYQREMRAAQGDLFSAAVSGNLQLFNENLDTLGTQLVWVTDSSVTHQEQVRNLQEQYDAAGQTLNDYLTYAKGATLTEEERAEKIQAVRDEMGILAQRMAEVGDITGHYTERVIEATVNQDAVNQSLYDAVDAAGANATQLAILGTELGLFSEDAAEAALKTALIQEKIAELAKEYKEGKTFFTIRQELEDFIAGLDDVEVPDITPPPPVELDVNYDRLTTRLGEADSIIKDTVDPVEPYEVELEADLQILDTKMGLAAESIDMLVNPAMPYEVDFESNALLMRDEEIIPLQEETNAYVDGGPYFGDFESNALLIRDREVIPLHNEAEATAGDYYITFHIRTEGSIPNAAGQHGLDMIVPGGYPNDSFLIGATSGERVTIQTAGQRQNNVRNYNNQGATYIIQTTMNEQQLQRFFLKRGIQANAWSRTL